jgi:hypothetical protein
VKASFGIDPAVSGLTYRDLQARRALIRDRLSRKKTREPKPPGPGVSPKSPGPEVSPKSPGPGVSPKS